MTTTSWYAAPETLKQLLGAATQSWDNPDQSEQFMRQVLDYPNLPIDVLVSAYRYFFYKHNNDMALTMTEQVLARVQTEQGLPNDWEALQVVLQQRQDETAMRLYLNAYSAKGLLLARLGQPEAALAIAAQIKAIDPKNEFGADVVISILTAPPEEDD